MTLILTLASRKYVLQVSDRLVTTNQAPFDRLANKNIVLYARNALVSIGYTGQAMLGKTPIPTDQWLVEKITGFSYKRGRRPYLFSQTKFPWLDIGKCLQLLKRNLDSARSDMLREWRADWTRKSFDVALGGWQWDKKGRHRPIIGWLSKPPDSNDFKIGFLPRYWYLEKKIFVGVAPSNNIVECEGESLMDAISSKSIDETESLMVECIRDISKRIPEVGPNCMSILISPPSDGVIRIRYLPVKQHFGVLTSRSASERIPIMFSPWFVGKNSILAPAVGGSKIPMQIGQCPYSLIFETPKNQRLRVMLQGQERPTFNPKK